MAPQTHPYFLTYLASPSIAAFEYVLSSEIPPQEVARELVRATETEGGPMARLVTYQILRRVRVGRSSERRTFYYVAYTKQMSTVCRFGNIEVTTNAPIRSIDQVREVEEGLRANLGEVVTITRFVSLAPRSEAGGESC